MIDSLEGRWGYDHDIIMEAYQADALLVAGYLYLSALLHDCGLGPAAGEANRDNAAAVIHDKCECVLDANYLGSVGRVDQYTTRWIRSCVSYVERRKKGEINFTTRVEDYPFERV